MSERFAGRAAIVTGASRGIGAAVARAFHAAGASVGLIARDGAALERLAGELGRDDGRALALPADVTAALRKSRLDLISIFVLLRFS